MSDADPVISTIVVGVDGSDTSLAAVAWAARLGRQLGARLVITHALSLLEHYVEADPVAGNQVRDRVQELLTTEWSAPAVAAGVAHTCVLEDGPAVLAIERVVEREQADLVVVASQGSGGAPQRMLGSTSHGVAQLSTVPVVIL